MKHIYKDMLLILKSSITGEKFDLSESIDLENIMELSYKHSITPLVFVGALNCGISKENPIMIKMFQGYCQALCQHEQQIFELNKIYDAFESNNIKYMPVKGCNMKKYYPKPEMRVMGDADILIDTRQYSKIEEILSKLGFDFKSRGDHDYAWDSDGIHLELHYDLMYSYNKQYEEYFGNGWKLAKFVNESKYSMSYEDEFIYLFVHFTKHYRISGIGCRHVVDLWVYLINHKDLDFKYIERIMKSLSIYKFYKNTIHLIDVWFNGEDEDDISEYMTEYIFNSGSWGSIERRMEARALEIKQNEDQSFKGRVKGLVKILFPPLKVMQKRYLILEYKSYLLPIMWIRKWIESIFLRPQNVIAAKKEMKMIIKDDLLECEKHLKKVGLNFTFDEKTFNKEKLKDGKK